MNFCVDSQNITRAFHICELSQEIQRVSENYGAALILWHSQICAQAFS